MRYGTWPNLATMFFDQAARLGDKPFLWAKGDDVFEPLTWRQTADRARRLARGLRARGLRPGARVMLVSEGRPEWLIADVAIMAAGGITVPAYTTNTVDDHLHIIENSGAQGVIVSTRGLAANLFPAALRGANLEFVITIEAAEMTQSAGFRLFAWDEILDEGERLTEDVEAAASSLARADTACLIYTSGTAGAPKGVMLSHGAILSNCAGAHQVLAKLGLEDEVFLSFLPLSHSYEHTAGQFLPMSIGAQIYYAESAESLARNLLEARPTLMTAVPRLYETLHHRITLGVSRQGRIRQELFAKALALGRLAYERPEEMSTADRLANAALDRLVRNKVRRRFGGRLKALVSGGAPLNYEIGLFFTALGLQILQGYGLTESAPVISCNPPDDNRLDTVGPPLPGVEVRIAPDGEILVRGELLMQGYWGDRQATEEALRDGWLHTGDVGEIGEDGYIRITDRKKDIIVNSGGDNISPQRVEGFLTLQEEIAQAMVCGDEKPYLVAVIVPEEGFAKTWASASGRKAELAGIAGDPEFHTALAKAVERVNETLSQIERVRRFIIAAEPFTMEGGLLTPTLKIRRHKIREIYGAALEALYGGGAGGGGKG